MNENQLKVFPDEERKGSNSGLVTHLSLRYPLLAPPVLFRVARGCISGSQPSVALAVHRMGGVGIGGREQGEAWLSLSVSLCFEWHLQRQLRFPPGLVYARESFP